MGTSGFVEIRAGERVAPWRTLRTLLLKAISYGKLEIVKYLTENHTSSVNIDLEGSLYRWDAIRRGVTSGHLDIVEYFVEEGIKKNKQPDLTHTYHEFRSLLFLAVDYRYYDVITYLTEKKKVDLTWVDEKEENVLFKAVRQGNLDFIKHVLDEEKVKIDINWRNDEGCTLVHLSLIKFKWINNAETILRYLISEKHADLNIPFTKHGNETPLLYAAAHLPFEIIQFLIENGADPNKQDINGHTALHWALFDGNVERGLEICEYLCKHGANVNLENGRGKTPMTIALKRLPQEARLLEVCKLFLEYGVDLNSTDRRGNLFVHIAVIKNNLNFLDYLVREKQDDVNTPRERDNITPLHWAAFGFHFEICKYLIEHGAKVDLKNQRNETPFDMSLKKNECYGEENAAKVWKLFLENGASLDSTDGMKGNKLLHIAVKRRYRKFLDYLVRDRNVDINTPRESDGWTPLHIAASQYDAEICKYLIEHGARVNPKNKNDETPADTAFTNRDFSWKNVSVTNTYKLFVNNGARLNQTDKTGNQFVHAAVMYGRMSDLKFMIRRKGNGVDINAPREWDGWTPLHLAAYAYNSEICQYLIEHGSRVNQKNKRDETPLDLLMKNFFMWFSQFQEIIDTSKVLIEHGANVNTTDERGNQLVHNAALYTETSFLEYLINDKQVDINTPRESDNWTPLHCAAHKNQYEKCVYLINHGANVEAKSKDEETFLQVAGRDTRRRLLDYLISVSNTRRDRRNVMNHFLTLPQNLKYQESRYESIAEPENRSVKCFPRYDSSFQFQNFFCHLSLLMRYFVGVSSHSSQISQLPKSTTEILQSRMESIAVDAVNYFANCTGP